MGKVIITKIYRSSKDKKGNLLVTQDGREYTRLAIKTKEYGDRYLSGFGNEKNASWKVGDTVEITVEESGQYLNFSMPKEKDLLLERVEKLENEVKAIWDKIYEAKEEPDFPEPTEEEQPF